MALGSHPSGDGDDSFARELAASAGRLRLLFAHLAGPRLRASAELDDLVQETLLRALASPNRPSTGAAELARWLNAIARHVAVDAARALRARRRAQTPLRLERADWSRVGLRESQLAASTAGAATRLSARDDEQRLAEAFARLSAEHRRVIGLRQFEGLSAGQAATRLQRSESAVHSLYRRALQAWAEAAR